MKVAARPDKTRNPSDEACWVSRLRKNLTSGSYGEGLETGWALRPAPRQSFTRQLFFKWIKQNLRIKTFLGTSKNAVITQIWIALCVYLLLAFIKFQSTLDKSMRQILTLRRTTCSNSATCTPSSGRTARQENGRLESTRFPLKVNGTAV